MHEKWRKACCGECIIIIALSGRTARNKSNKFAVVGCFVLSASSLLHVCVCLCAHG